MLVAVGVWTHPSPAASQTATAPVLKAALLYNFAKFVEWPALPPGASIVLCVQGDEGIANALAETIRGQSIAGRSLEVSRRQDRAGWNLCHVLFIADADARRSTGLSEIRAQPILTVSDGKGFSQAGGIVELYIEAGKMRFAINVDAAERSGLRLSSRLLGLAKVIRDGHAQ